MQPFFVRLVSRPLTLSCVHLSHVQRLGYAAQGHCQETGAAAACARDSHPIESRGGPSHCSRCSCAGAHADGVPAAARRAVNAQAAAATAAAAVAGAAGVTSAVPQVTQCISYACWSQSLSQALLELQHVTCTATCCVSSCTLQPVLLVSMCNAAKACVLLSKGRVQVQEAAGGPTVDVTGSPPQRQLAPPLQSAMQVCLFQGLMTHHRGCVL